MAIRSPVLGLIRLSYQQTGSAQWVVELGGGTINDEAVQSYLRWQQTRYNYNNIGTWGGGWDYLLVPGYFLFSTAKAGSCRLEEQGTPALPGNLTPEDIGILAADAGLHRVARRNWNADPWPHELRGRVSRVLRGENANWYRNTTTLTRS